MPNKSSREQTATCAVLVSVTTHSTEELSSSAEELRALAGVLGIQVRHTLCQRRTSAAGPKFLGEGKLRELARLAGRLDRAGDVGRQGHSSVATCAAALKDQEGQSDPPDRRHEDEAVLPGAVGASDGDERVDTVGLTSEVDCVLVDGTLSPSQQRSIEQATELPVYDRTAIVLQVFERHARTRQAQLQVELARRMHELPRLRDDSSKSGREGGGGRGERGHKNVVLDKQKCRARIAELRHELDRIQRSVTQQRAHREGIPEVALVGYTNVGKSTLLRALTGSDVLVRDAPFATLGTTVRRMQKTPGQTVLVSDTVGFMQGLPHELVASFHATLEAARQADLLLIVSDASSPTCAMQVEVAERTLDEVGAGQVPRLHIFNKVDRLTREELAEKLREFPEGLWMSAHRAEDVARLRAQILDRLRATEGPVALGPEREAGLALPL